MGGEVLGLGGRSRKCPLLNMGQDGRKAGESAQ